MGNGELTTEKMCIFFIVTAASVNECSFLYVPTNVLANSHRSAQSVGIHTFHVPKEKTTKHVNRNKQLFILKVRRFFTRDYYVILLRVFCLNNSHLARLMLIYC